MKTKPRWMLSVIEAAKVEDVPPLKRRKKSGEVADQRVTKQA